jgi:predicted  nucleic acid-binding Zn-ribbon protein
MTPDVIAIIAVGIALGGLMLAMFQTTNKRFDSIELRLSAMEQRFTSFEERFAALEQRQARLEGLMEGIRDMLARMPLTQ